MENLVGNLKDKNLFNGVYAGKKVLVTGHTGFKGSWMVYWLTRMGAEVCGYSTTAPTNPAHIDELGLDIKSVIGDIRDSELLENTFKEFNPDAVFHMAAQPLVRLSYEVPLETFETNVIGSLKVYEACRKTASVKAIVTITTDKVYHNNEWTWGYRECDRLGGKDPYSASKAAMELMTNSYRHSYFHEDKFGKDHSVLMATVRAGNVIGGGDWAKDRLIPDIVNSSLENNPVEIRSPYSVRPWQHVLEPLSGYLMLGQKLIEKDVKFSDAYNFGPSVTENLQVEEVVKILKKFWDEIDYKIVRPKDMPHEAGLLKLDCTKAFTNLRWEPVWGVEKALEKTIVWYKEYYENKNLYTANDLDLYIKDAKEMNQPWAK